MASDPAARSTRRVVRIGKYDVVAHIATGGMGAVYRAIDTEAGREVALKVLSPETAANPSTLERFRREAKHTAKLRHDNIVTLFECGEANGTHFIAMEFVDGIDLHDYINRKGQLDTEESRQIMIQAAQALDHASQQGIIHRDIKPSNFLLAQKDGNLVVKLTDMGLAREANEDEFRVTRDGSTVGTVDYLSPEQARDSRGSDVRSDIYSLGCTLYHMLAGKPPFPVGSMAERIYKHIQVEPPDIRQFNPQVSDAFWDVLKRMLAKSPDKRYQTATALLSDLHRLENLEALPREFDENAPLDQLEEKEKAPRSDEPDKPNGKKTASDPDRKRVTTTARRTPPRIPKRPSDRGDRQDTAERPAAKTTPIIPRQKPLHWAAGVAAAVLAFAAVLGIVLLVFPLRSRPTSPSGDENPIVEHDPSDMNREPELLTHPPRLVEEIRPVVPHGRWPALFPGIAAIDLRKIRDEFEKPWAAAPASASDPVLRVGRSQRGSAGQFDSLAAAFAAAPVGKTTVIELCDNGPFFDLPAATADRSLILRAAKNYRPLLVWDIDRSRAGAGASAPLAFLSVSRGNLTLQGLDVALHGTDAAAGQRLLLVRVANGDFLAEDCTFSVAGKHKGGVVAVHFEGADAPGKKCRLSRCLVRGTSLCALDLTAPGAEVMLDGCLIAGGDQPLLQVTAAEPPKGTLGERKTPPPTLRVMRSTLVSGVSVLQVRPSTAADMNPAVHCKAWDSLFARSGALTGGEMIAFSGGTGAEAMQWNAANCLYAGWKVLLAGRETIPADDHKAWLQRWKMREGDAVLNQRWPVLAQQELAEVLPDSYRTEDTPFAFIATDGKGTLGCGLTALPPARDNWLTLTYQPLSAPPVDILNDPVAPEIPMPGDDLYHGERLDLDRTELSGHLDRILRSGKKLGPRVVFHLHGSGQRMINPIRIKGSSLVLFFEPPEKKPGGTLPAPLFLVSSESATDTLIDVDDGDLEIIGGDIRFPDSKLALAPRHMLRVRGGNLLLLRCRLTGPLIQPAARFQGLIRLEGPEGGKPDATTGCAINRSVLLSGKGGIELAGANLHLRLQHSLLVARQDAFRLEPGQSRKGAASEVSPRLNVQCLVEYATVAAQRAVLFLGDAPALKVPAEPIVFQAKACAFLNPFADPQSRDPLPAIFLLHDGDALARGLLLWRGEGNVFDNRLHAYALPAAVPLRPQQQPFTTWPRLWGTPGERQPILDLPLKGRLEPNLTPLDNLLLTGLPRMERPPGANLTLLGVVKKP